eukprot:11223408-Lingulodinium_polyedra.AAC.1
MLAVDLGPVVARLDGVRGPALRHGENLLRLRDAWSFRMPRTSRMSFLVMGRSPMAERSLQHFRKVI